MTEIWKNINLKKEIIVTGDDEHSRTSVNLTINRNSNKKRRTWTAQGVDLVTDLDTQS